MTSKYLGFEMKKGEDDRKDATKKLGDGTKDTLEEPTQSWGLGIAELDSIREPEHHEYGPVLQRDWSSSPFGSLTELTR